MKTLVLDFDGVIADSRMECLFVGFNSYLTLNKGTTLFNGQKLTFDNFNGLAEKHKETVEKYKELRPYVIDAFCWYAILYAIEHNIKIKNKPQYDSLRAELIKGNYDVYTRHFYAIRGSLQEENFSKWLKLEAPFNAIIGAIKQLEHKFAVAIATNNRKGSILPFLDNYGIKPKIISDSKISTDKTKQLQHIRGELGINFNDMHFVDDNVAHFPLLLKLKVNCYLAAWGYNTREQLEEAKKLGAVLLGQDDFYKTFSKMG